MTKRLIARRKLQSSGENSFHVYLPLVFIKSQGLKKGDSLKIYQQVNGDIVLAREGKKKPVKVVDVEPKRDDIDFSDPNFALGVLGFKKRSKKALNDEVK